MSEATQRGKSEGNCRTSQGSKFFFPTFPYLLLVVCSEAVLACFRGYGLWAHAWYLCHFHGSKKKSLLFSILGGKKIKEEFPICKLTYAHMSLLQQHTLRSRIFVKKTAWHQHSFPLKLQTWEKATQMLGILGPCFYYLIRFRLPVYHFPTALTSW